MPSDLRLNELLHQISEGYVLVDRDFRILEMNAEAARLDGRPAAEMVGRIMWDAWPQYVPGTPLRDLWEGVMRTRTPALLEQESVRDYRGPLWLEVRGFPSGDGIAIFYRDISDRKRSELELKRTQAELIHASRNSAMGAMASTLAHELSQPLTSVANYLETAETMLAELPVGEARKARQALGFANAAAHRASEILRRLRAFVSRGQIEVELHDLQVIIADAGVLVLPHAQRQSVEIRFALDRFAKWVEADAVQIQQVLVNLIRNAIEAMEGCAEKQILISTRPLQGGAIEVAVEDNGPGLGEGGEEKVFHPFHSSKSEGMGVGLSISRTIVEAHGGAITAERPATGRGAVFRFTLPRGTPPRGVHD